jgi:hypothetical protein
LSYSQIRNSVKVIRRCARAIASILLFLSEIEIAIEIVIEKGWNLDFDPDFDFDFDKTGCMRFPWSVDFMACKAPVLLLINRLLMVGVAQLVEHLVVAQDAVGSSPITHPIRIQRPR